MRNDRQGFVIAAAALALLSSAAAGQPATPSYKLVASVPLGPGERWDYATFEPSEQRVYVAHGDHVTVVDLASEKAVGDIGTFPGGTHGIGIVPAAGLGYTDDGRAGTAGAFDLKTLQVQATLPAAPDADGIIFDRASGHIFVVDGDSGAITVIEPGQDKPIATISVGAGLEAGIPDGKGHLYVDGVAAHDMIAIDTRTNSVLAHWPMPDCVRPHGIAVDAERRRIFATCSNKMMFVLNADTGAIVASLPIGAGSDGAAFDPVHSRALSSNGDGTLSIIQEIDADHFVAQEPVKTAPSGRTIAIDPATGRVFIPAADIAKIDPATTPGGRPHATFVPGSLKLLILEPQS